MAANSYLCAYTPGPWKHESELMIDFHSSPHFCIGSFRNPEDCATSKANARLIAAAPDLLAALEEALPWLAARSNTDTLMKAEAAIAKATGTGATDGEGKR